MREDSQRAIRYARTCQHAVKDRREVIAHAAHDSGYAVLPPPADFSFCRRSAASTCPVYAVPPSRALCYERRQQKERALRRTDAAFVFMYANAFDSTRATAPH